MQNSEENTCARDSFLIKFQSCNFIRNESLVQVFSSEFCEISKNIFFYGTSPVADPVSFIKINHLPDRDKLEYLLTFVLLYSSENAPRFHVTYIDQSDL